MNLTEADKKYLTEEVLGECWHEVVGEIEDDGVHRTYCTKCDRDRSYGDYNHRTFTTQADMMALYSALFKAGKWEEFYWNCKGDWIFEREFRKEGFDIGESKFTAWLFCLSDEEYGEACARVIEFWKGAK
jgi:hypothetical protein